MSYWNFGSNDRFCLTCNKSFKFAYGTCQRYCSNACKQKDYRRRKKGRYLPDQQRNTSVQSNVTLHQVQNNTFAGADSNTFAGAESNTLPA